PTSITTLTELIQNSQNTKIRQEAAKYLSIIDPNNSIALTASIDFIFNYQPDELNKFNYQDTVRSLKPGYIFSPTTKFGMQRVITILKEYLSKEIYNNWGYSACCEILWEYAENMPYLDFYEAWYNQPTTHPEAPDNIPVGNTLLTQSLENQINDILTQLQPTTQTYPLPINIQSLTDETDINAICQEICTLIYSLALPDADIPSANNFAQLKRHILTAKRQLQKRHLALILHECTPHATLINCCRQIADANIGLHILWITDTPLNAPLRGFPPQQPNLLGVIQTWINELN
uniref:NACHT C-terminal alpha/beta 1 domain-containing protein n=1 Tax=Microcoleus sp. LEGE 07076 TaxID=915322 RepID=UPI001A01880E|nr:hypothetical protein [Microcoleus sp. LEGE 07076]